MKTNNNGYTILDYLLQKDRVVVYQHLINEARNATNIQRANALYEDLRKKARYVADLLIFKTMAEKSGVCHLISERQECSLINELVILHEFLEEGINAESK